ncbi:MAG: GNAT family protein [Candidatus Endonucleobacter bathymodioli]|uniref:GNAT family protein n=1 Tax=Candidatus Endonucleibacter bathymodioli TaxID=539814 RepID=A0AA90NLG4_9GAMM|nr:GNAT family protein [Candidatus Endonucleobacter bathymodioli]
MRFELGDGYCIRGFLYGDALSLAKHADNKNIAKHLRDSFPSPYTVGHARLWIQYVKEHEPKTRFVIAYKEQAIGEIGFLAQMDVHRFSAELGYWLSEEHWGRGIMSRTIALICNYAFEKHNIVRIYADVIEYNKASCKVLEKCGFEIEAVFQKHVFKYEKFYNQYLYALVR